MYCVVVVGEDQGAAIQVSCSLVMGPVSVSLALRRREKYFLKNSHFSHYILTFLPIKSTRCTNFSNLFLE